MDRDAWHREYRRLLTAYGKSTNAEQAAEYFRALGGYSVLVVGEAITVAIRESRTWPSIADLVERCRTYLAGHAAPASVCTTCHGSGWVTRMGAPQTIRMPLYRPGGVSYTEKQWQPEYAERCPQCWARKDPAA